MEKEKVPQYQDGQVLGIVMGDCQNSRSFDNIAWAEGFVYTVCQRIGMTALRSQVAVVDDADLTKNGVSCVLIMKESHIAVHTWPYYHALRIEISSCKDFDTEGIIMWLQSHFAPKEMVSKVVSYK